MQKSINVDNKKINYTLKESKRARRMRLAVYGDGSVVVTRPYNLKDNIVEEFLRKKSKWLIAKIKAFTQNPPQKISRYTRADYLKYVESARELVANRLEYYNSIYRYTYNKVAIRNQKTRWGSCSKKGYLNFNFKILFLDKKLQDYIIVHELCHLEELNHSKGFWNLVARVFPDWREIKKELRKKSLTLL